MAHIQIMTRIQITTHIHIMSIMCKSSSSVKYMYKYIGSLQRVRVKKFIHFPWDNGGEMY